ncbi:hypothetical protein BMETH_1765_0 [methanotrophic bacterial endosymbiont of Bathymodiolus sp.]|nr:hypothetical protein BMETH_1765_0 [methanotrophic bacterial endosymbiont of Bathymodiolus sp.]
MGSLAPYSTGGAKGPASSVRCQCLPDYIRLSAIAELN